MTSTTAGTHARTSEGIRWAYLACAIVCMVMIANLQYGWTLFVNPINKTHGWSIASIQLAFAVFIALETWLTPIEGWIVDSLGAQRGPKLVVAFGGIMVGIGWVINAYADSLTMLYLGAVISGIGGGAVYATSVGLAVKWFPDRRGLAVGLTAAGYGAGAALTVIPIRYVIDTYNYETAFLWFGLIQGGVVFVMAWFLRGPEPGEMASAPAPKVVQSARNFTPAEVLVSPVFWLLYVMFVMVSASGLMATAPRPNAIAIVYSRPMLSEIQPNSGRAAPLAILSMMRAAVSVVAPKKMIESPTLKSFAIGAICAVAISPLADTMTNMT